MQVIREFAINTKRYVHVIDTSCDEVILQEVGSNIPLLYFDAHGGVSDRNNKLIGQISVNGTEFDYLECGDVKQSYVSRRAEAFLDFEVLISLRKLLEGVSCKI